MTILLISLSAYFLLCVAATIAMKLPPQEFLGDVSEIVGNDFNKLGRVLATIFVATVLFIIYVLIFVAMPVLFVLFYKKRKEDIRREVIREAERKKKQQEDAEEKKRMEKVDRKSVV